MKPRLMPFISCLTLVLAGCANERVPTLYIEVQPEETPLDEQPEDPSVVMPPSTDCSPGDRQCLDEHVWECAEGKWVSVMHCQGQLACNGNTIECRPDKPQCTQDKCDKGQIFRCLDGVYDTGAACESGQCADNTQCAPSCTQSQCDSGMLRECSDHRLLAATQCPSHACNAEKTACEPPCTNDRCRDGHIQTCNSGIYADAIPCQSHLCADETECAAPCTQNLCADGIITECVQGVMNAPVPCASKQCASETACVPPCTQDICADGKLQVCNSGILAAPVDCDMHICLDETQCKPLGAECASNACNAGTLAICTDGHVSASGACPKGCSDSKHCTKHKETFTNFTSKTSFNQSYKSKDISGITWKISNGGNTGMFTSSVRTIEGIGVFLQSDAVKGHKTSEPCHLDKGNCTTGTLTATIPNGVSELSMQVIKSTNCPRTQNAMHIRLYLNDKLCQDLHSQQGEPMKCTFSTQGSTKFKIEFAGRIPGVFDNIVWYDYPAETE